MRTTFILATAAALILSGCATAPQPPNSTQMVMDILNHHGMTADQINQTYADYAKARAEYEQTATYKMAPYLIAPLLLLGEAANEMPYCGYRGSGYGYRGYHGYGGKTVINTVPTGGGSYSTTIKGYP